MRAPCSISTRRSSRASPRSPRSRSLRRSTASISQALGRSELGIESKLSSNQGRALLALLGLDRAIAAGEGPAQFEGSATRRVGCAAAAEGEDLGSGARCRSGRLCRAMGAGGQGQCQSEGSQRRFRAAARSQTVRHAGAEYRPVLARFARRQQADLRRSRQQHCRFAAARACGGHAWATKKTSRARSASTSSRWRRPLRWRSARPDMMPPSRSARGW